ncbi:protein phosphatase 1 regulatory subunit 42 [Mariniblastus sp.]|nr:protein phosphatase 1 regulatory subunit 42 [Mariniblastus sp.]
MFPYFRIALVLAAFVFLPTVHQKLANAQTNTGNSAAIDWRVARQSLEFQFGQDLAKIGVWCNKNGLARQKEITFELKVTRDLNRQYLFLPVAESMPDPSQQTGLMKEWQEQINTAKVAHAGRIFKLARRALDQDAAAVAFQLLYEVVYHDRDHAEARRILGHKPKDDGWRLGTESFRDRQSAKQHDFLAIGKGYLLVETPHFKIESTATKERTEHLATQLELWHTVWRQVFFDYWGSKKSFVKSFDGKQTMSLPKRKFKIFFFQNRQQYANLLAPHVPGIGASSGYYSNKLETSFFSDGDSSAEATWRHELTHQLFREAKGSSPANAFEKNFIWLDEGVATYAESMVDLGNFVTLGGFEAPRTQHAREQALLSQTPLRSAVLNAMSQLDWQSRRNPKLYSQSSGIVDMLMNSEHGRHQPDLISLLKYIYHRQAKPSSFNRILKMSFDQVDQQFLQFMKIDEDMVSKFLSKPETRTYLILTAAKLSKNDYRELGKCVNLEILDLSQHILKADDLKPLANCPALHQLILSSCKFEPNALLTLSKLPGLTKLNLVGSQIGPTQANEIAQLKQLKPGLVIKQ